MGGSGRGAQERLLRIERYYDAVPRAAADVEAWGPLTLFIQRPGAWPYYARPALGSGAHTPFQPADVQRVRERQRELGIPQAFEWVHDVTPGLRAAVERGGLSVHTHPLMVLDPEAMPLVRPPLPEDVTIRLVGADEPDTVLRQLDAVAHLGFGAAGTAIGPTGLDALVTWNGGPTAAQLAFRRERLRAGRTVSAVGEVRLPGHTDSGSGGPPAHETQQPQTAALVSAPVSVGSHQPLDRVTEVVGVATLPAFRRRGIGAAVVHALLQDALSRGVEIVFLTAGDDAVARVYTRLGFRRIATACIAEPAA